MCPQLAMYSSHSAMYTSDFSFKPFIQQPSDSDTHGKLNFNSIVRNPKKFHNNNKDHAKLKIPFSFYSLRLFHALCLNDRDHERNKCTPYTHPSPNVQYSNEACISSSTDSLSLALFLRLQLGKVAKKKQNRVKSNQTMLTCNLQNRMVFLIFVSRSIIMWHDSAHTSKQTLAIDRTKDRIVQRVCKQSNYNYHISLRANRT